jgi:hypothetical protein
MSCTIRRLQIVNSLLTILGQMNFFNPVGASCSNNQSLWQRCQKSFFLRQENDRIQLVTQRSDEFS